MIETWAEKGRRGGVDAVSESLIDTNNFIKLYVFVILNLEKILLTTGQKNTMSSYKFNKSSFETNQPGSKTKSE